jgi:hypothetical protein
LTYICQSIPDTFSCPKINVPVPFSGRPLFRSLFEPADARGQIGERFGGIGHARLRLLVGGLLAGGASRGKVGRGRIPFDWPIAGCFDLRRALGKNLESLLMKAIQFLIDEARRRACDQAAAVGMLAPERAGAWTR